MNPGTYLTDSWSNRQQAAEPLCYSKRNLLASMDSLQGNADCVQPDVLNPSPCKTHRNRLPLVKMNSVGVQMVERQGESNKALSDQIAKVANVLTC